jgi:hypothetical protein
MNGFQKLKFRVQCVSEARTVLDIAMGLPYDSPKITFLDDRDNLGGIVCKVWLPADLILLFRDRLFLNMAEPVWL